MHQVISQNHFLTEVLGQEEHKSEYIYKSSIFNIVIRHDNQLLVYNTMSKLFIATELKYAELFCGNSKSASDLLTDNADMMFFVKFRLLTRITANELQLYEEVNNLIRTIEGENSGIDRYNILTTTSCNARCFYCFEEGIKAANITPKIAEDIVQYINKTRNKDKVIQLRWFGGEPLVNINAIDHISTRLKELGIDFESSMSSNGYLFNDKIIEKACSVWNLCIVRISFDGMDEEHNRRKNYPHKGNPFFHTIHNIDRLTDAAINVDIRLTLDHNNKKSILDAAHYTAARYKGSPHVKIYTRCIFGETTSDAAEKDFGRVSSLIRFKEKIDDFLRSKKMFDYERLLPIGYHPYYCAANDPHKVVIVPDGRLCNCETVKKNTLFFGDVVSGITAPNIREEWLEYNAVEGKCRSCRFLPSCTTFRKCPNDYFDCAGRCQTAYSNYLTYRYNEYKKTGMLSS